MRTSSTRRLGAVSLATLLALFTFASPAVAGGKSDDHRAGRPWVSGSTDDDSMDDPSPVDDNAHPSGKDRHEDNGTQGKSTSDPDDNGSGPERHNTDEYRNDGDGADKPFEGEDGLGGIDDADEDGNNGCGNDDDFEDDNEGWCGGKPKKASTTPPGSPEVGGTKTETCPEGKTMVEGGTNAKDCKTPEIGAEGTGKPVEHGTTMTNTGPGSLLASELQNASAGFALTPDTVSVLGVQFERTAPAAVAAETAAAPASGGVAAAGTAVLGAALARTGLSFTVLALAIALGLLAIGFALKRAGRTQSDF